MELSQDFTVTATFSVTADNAAEAIKYFLDDATDATIPREFQVQRGGGRAQTYWLDETNPPTLSREEARKIRPGSFVVRRLPGVS